MSETDPIGTFYRENGFLVYRRCVKMLRDHAAAEDATHWTFVRALEVGIDVSHRPRALAWLYKTATRRCLTLIRNRKTRGRIREAHPDDFKASAPPSAEGRTLSRDLLNKAVARVDEQAAEVALLTWGQGLTNDRAAEVLGVSKRTVIRARKRFEAIVNSLDTSREAS